MMREEMSRRLEWLTQGANSSNRTRRHHATNPTRGRNLRDFLPASPTGGVILTCGKVALPHAIRLL